jgi:16S rRNA C967 or C1407 C5-methylase (RsmB/RsmF family)
MGPGASPTANDVSGQRRERLRRVLSEHLPLDILARVTVTGYDASAWLLHEREGFDRILLDAPCSSERHLLSSEKHLSTWTPSRSRHLAVRQFALLASAIEVVKVGGIVVYSTCSISPLENDEVVRKLLRKRPGRIEVVRQAGTAGEETEFGKYFLPDRSGGKGPIYYTVLRRIT